jgi:hypothetical protein
MVAVLRNSYWKVPEFDTFFEKVMTRAVHPGPEKPVKVEGADEGDTSGYSEAAREGGTIIE